MSAVSLILTIAFMLCSAVLLIFGLHHYVMLFFFWRSREKIRRENERDGLGEVTLSDAELPEVLTQIPLYNEYNVAERVIRAVAAIDYPQDKHIIQVLDDSSDDTVGLVDRVVASLQAEGYRIEAVRREVREGFKAGALDYGLKQCDADYVAIFDSDFIPPAEFFKRTLAHLLEKPQLGLVQARWGSINTEESPLTKAQGLGIDGHFIIEQTARAYNGLFLNFNGTAGLWRRETIDDAGGWTSDTLTEDLELSYRAQLKGWKFHYLPNLVVPAEIPESYSAFRSQQFRWAKGSIQTARMMLGQVWKSNISLLQKVEATFHLTHYSIHFCMFVHALLGLPILLIGSRLSDFASTWYLVPLAFAIVGPSLLYLCAQAWSEQGTVLRFFRRLPVLMLVGFGICFSNARACVEGFIGIVSPFVRTPKKGAGGKVYRVKMGVVPMIEVFMCLYTLTAAILYLRDAQYATGLFFGLYAGGFGLFGFQSVLASLASRRGERVEENAAALTS